MIIRIYQMYFKDWNKIAFMHVCTLKLSKQIIILDIYWYILF
jgi:hypothetical protein